MSAAPVEAAEAADDGALERAEAAERAQFELGVRRDLWARARARAWPVAARARRAVAAGGRSAWAARPSSRPPRAHARRPVERDGGRHAAAGGRRDWQCDLRAKEVTSFGLPGYTAFAQLRGSVDGKSGV